MESNCYDEISPPKPPITVTDDRLISKPKSGRPKTNIDKATKQKNRNGDDCLNRRFTHLLLKNLRLNKKDNRKLLSCDICQFRAPIRYKMVMHMTRFHTQSVEDDAKLFGCEFCGKRFFEKVHLTTHRRSHTGEKPYVCSVDSCNRGFTSASERRLHVRRHLGEKPFQCDQCPLAFLSKTAMNYHKSNIHSEERPFNCEMCEMSFKRRAGFLNHQLTHSEIRNFNCGICGKSFRQSKALQVHVNIHTDHRPYGCSICKHGFHSSSARRSHERFVHKLA